MILDKVNSPQDLKKLSIPQLNILAEEIRKLIIEVVSKKGGHLASSLGAVELCIALHYCFDTPKDSLIFDVGHQCYTHKIITGRKHLFSKLREYKGISGFPNSRESEYDLFISGHASTALSWALGLAEAKKIKGEHTKTIAVIGDGSLSGGMCFEALNMCGHCYSDVLVILNHNEMSISPSVGALNTYLTKIISLPIYNKIKDELERFLKHLPFAKRLAPKVRKFEEAVKGLIVPGLFFEEIGFRYFGPLDGHNLEVLIPTLKNLGNLPGPKLLHLVTKKGKGYRPAEDNPEKFHSASPSAFKYTLEKEGGTFSHVFAKKLVSLAKKDGQIVAITAAMAEGTGLNLFRQMYPSRFFDVGIAEENAVGIASGLAKAGLKPVVAVYSTFLQRAFDQIIHDVALQNLGVIFAVDRAGFVGEDGPTHHGIFDISYLRMIPNMVCMAPKDKEELEDMLEFASTINGPVALRYPKGKSFSLKHREKVVLGKAQVLEEGDDICIIALGSLVIESMKVCVYLKRDGINPFLINARFIKPLDEELLLSLVSKFKLIIILEEGILEGGFGTGILEFYEKYNVLDRINIKRLGIKSEFPTFAKREELLRLYNLDAQSIYCEILKALKEEALWQK